MSTQHAPAWRVTAYNPTDHTALVEQFTTEPDARHYAGILRGKHPTWDIDIIPTRRTH